MQETYQAELEEWKEPVQSVVKALGPMDHTTLELIATLDFSYRWVHARGGNGPWKLAAIKKFKSIKKDKFPDKEINRWYDRLVKAQLIRK